MTGITRVAIAKDLKHDAAMRVRDRFQYIAFEAEAFGDAIRAANSNSQRQKFEKTAADLAPQFQTGK